MRRRAFTLIELLVVISIISLLASVVLASLNSARDKARIKGAAYFAAQIDHITGDQMVGSWPFDECTGTVVADISGSSDTGSLGTGATMQPDTPSGLGCAASFNGTGFMSVATYANLAPNDSDFTISFWIKGTGVGDVVQNTNGGNAGTFTGGYALVLPGGWSCATGKMFFNMGNGSSRDVGFCSKSFLNDGKWHHFALVVRRTANVTMYVDGAIDSQAATALTGSVTPGSFRVGGPGNWQNGYAGLMDEVRFSLKALTADQVRAIYAESAPRHPLADAIR